MKTEYYTDPKFKRLEIIKMGLFFPIFGLITYFLAQQGMGNMGIYLAILIPIGGFGIWQVMKNSKNRPSVIIDDKGLIINNPLELGMIEWEEIAGLRTEKIVNRQVLCIDLKDPSNHKQRLNRITKKQAETSEPKLKTHVAIMEKYVSYKLDEIKTKIQERIS